MTGDWAGSVQILRRVDVEGSEVPVVVLNDINLLVKIFDDTDSLLPDKTAKICSRKASLTPCQLENRIINKTINHYN